jgi:hypothetical protein
VVRPEKGDPVRVAKQYKILTHRYFPKAQYFIWNDASQQLLERITPELVEELLQGNQIAVHRHPQRKCIFKEAAFCIRKKKDHTRTIRKQMDRYRKEGMPRNYGLIRGGFFIRRNNPETNAFFEKWWEEISNGSRRDQLSFDSCRWKMGIKRHYMPRTRKTALYHHHAHHPGRHIELAIVDPQYSIGTYRDLFLEKGIVISLSDEVNTIMAKQSLLDKATNGYICLMDTNFNPKKTQIRFSGMINALKGKTGMIVPSSSRDKAKGRFTEVQDITGDCFIMRRSVFKEIGGLDTNYQVGYAERDLARRLMLSGYRVLQCNRSVLTTRRRKTNILLQQDKALFNSKRKLW